MKRLFLLFVAIFLYTSGSFVQAQYTTQSWVDDGGIQCFNAVALNDFYDYGNKIVIGIEKVNFSSYNDNMYVYAINIAQPANQPLYIPQKIVIASDRDGVAIDVYNPRIDRGQYTIIYKVFSYDLANINRIILESQNTLLISIKDTQNRIHNYFAPNNYINEIKQVANWS